MKDVVGAVFNRDGLGLTDAAKGLRQGRSKKPVLLILYVLEKAVVFVRNRIAIKKTN
jgi:hypothetical protein